MLKHKHPDIFFQGCVAHGLHLFVKDIFATTKAKRGCALADYPPGYPFEYLLTFINKSKDVVSFFHNHHAPKAQLKRSLAAANLKMLAQMAPARWGSIQSMVESLLAAETILHQLVSARDFISGTASQKETRQAIHNTVTSASFVDLLTKTLTILKPIDNAIKFYQSDSVPISEMYALFANKLANSIMSMPLIF